MMTDKKMILMTFATDNLYRKTGTTSQIIYDNNHTERMRKESVLIQNKTLRRIAREASRSKISDSKPTQ